MSETQNDQNDSVDQEEFDPEDISQEEKERYRREVEVEKGLLVPRWFKALVWGTLGPFCVFAFFWIGWSLVTQHQITTYLDVITGPWEDSPPAMSSDVVTTGLETFEEEPRSSLLFVLQEMVIDKMEDPRMARALTLQKATKWGGNSARRELFEELLAHMDSEGAMPPDYTLPAEDKKTLQNLIRERKQWKTASYEQEKITEVLVWIEEGRPTQAKGPERRRVAALEKKYDKRLLVGEESELLKSLAKEWEKSENPVKQRAAKKFKLMIEEKPCALSEEAVKLCKDEVQQLEERYLRGQKRLSEVALHLVQYIEKRKLFMDHPDIWEVMRLCEHEYKPVRENMKDATFALRNHQYCMIFIGDFLKRSKINPVMAVETARLTKDEHEALLRRENHRRRLALLNVAERIAEAYCRQPFPIEEVPAPKEDSFFKENILESIELVTEDDDDAVAKKASRILESIKEDCAEYLKQ